MSDKPIVIDGIRVSVSKDDFDDVEIVELYEDGKVTSVIRRILGEQKYAEVKEKLRDPETGRVTATALNAWFEKLMRRVGAGN